MLCCESFTIFLKSSNFGQNWTIIRPYMRACTFLHSEVCVWKISWPFTKVRFWQVCQNCYTMHTFPTLLINEIRIEDSLKMHLSLHFVNSTFVCSVQIGSFVLHKLLKMKSSSKKQSFLKNMSR